VDLGREEAYSERENKGGKNSFAGGSEVLQGRPILKKSITGGQLTRRKEREGGRRS